MPVVAVVRGWHRQYRDQLDVGGAWMACRGSFRESSEHDVASHATRISDSTKSASRPIPVSISARVR
jgi:hypothetical protein